MVFQLGSSLLDACVLAVLSFGSTYGYQLTQQLKRVIDVSDSTLYPVLRRLQKEGFLEVFDEPFDGRNRRYYRITEKGYSQLEFYRYEWNAYKIDVDRIIMGGILSEQN